MALQLGISPTASIAGRSPWAVKGRLPMRFDFDRNPPAAWVASRRDEPTIFASRAEAEAKVTDFLSRIRAVIRIARATNTQTDIGSATLLIPYDDGANKVGGYEVRDYAELLSERDEIGRFHASVAAEKLAAAEAGAAQAQQVADKLRAELPTASPRRAFTPASAGWVAVEGEPKIQVYVRQDGSKSFRCRDARQVSKGFDAVEEAIAWRDGDRAPKVTPEQRAAMEKLEDQVVRS